MEGIGVTAHNIMQCLLSQPSNWKITGLPNMIVNRVPPDEFVHCQSEY